MKRFLSFIIIFNVIYNIINEFDICSQNRTTGAKVFIRFQATSISFDCDICLKANESILDDTAEWYFESTQNDSVINISDEFFEDVNLGMNGILRMYNLKTDASGKYWCTINDTIISTIYYLHVDNGSEPTRTVHPNETPQPPSLLTNYNLKIYSEYTSWSSCSKCDEVGKKIRYGYCYIISTTNEILPYKNEATEVNFDYDDIINAENYYNYENLASLKKNTENDMEIDNNAQYDINYIIENIFPKFQNKLPCRSKYTPIVIQNIPDIKERKSEIIMSVCRVECTNKKVYEVRDKSGKVIESANNSAGIYAISQGIPEVMPMPMRMTLYKEFNKFFELTCPGLHFDTPVIWKIGLIKIVPHELKKLTSNRVYINEFGHIIFKKLRFSDSNIYSCWQENKLSGIIRLKVTREVEIEFNNFVLMFGIIIILTVFLIVFWKAYMGQKRFTKH